MRNLILLFACFFISMGLMVAQNKQVSGAVVDETGGPVVGASVVAKGANVGANTGADGKFSFSVPVSVNTLIVKYIGYLDAEIAAATNVQVILKENEALLDEVVITAMGIKRDTRALGYAISSVKGEDMIKAGVTANPLASLYGKAAGVGIQATAAGPMGGMRINIRGAQGLESTSGTRPLFVVDGVPMYDTESSMTSRGYDPLNSFDYGSAVNDINVEDIESMEILKGAKASVLYGSAGANGVVLITTKSGRGTRGLGVQIAYGQEWAVPYTLIDFQNEYGSGTNEYAFSEDENGNRRTVSSRFNFGPKFDGSPITFFDGSRRKYEAYPNNYLDLFDTGTSTNVTGTISGGYDMGNMRLSLSHYDYLGLMPNQEQKKNSLSFNGQMEVSKFAKFEFVQNLVSNTVTNRPSNLQHLIAFGTFNRDYDIKAAMNSYKDEKGNMYTLGQLASIDEAGWGWPTAFTDSRGIGFFNLLWNTNDNRHVDSRLHSITSAKATFQFLPYLSLIVNGGLDYSDTDYTTKDRAFRQDESTGKYEGGRFNYSRERTKIQNYEASLNFDNTYLEKLNVIARVGPAYRKVDYTNVGVGTMGNFKFPDYWSLKNGDSWPSEYDSRIADYSKEGEAIYSVWGQTEFSWGYEFILELSARNDWASTLPKANRSYFYPGAAFIWNFTETFEIPQLSFGKLRLNWADVGRPANRYYALRTYTMDALPAPNTNINDVTGPSDLFSGDLKPERRREFEAGFDLRMLKNRMEVNFSYYNSTFYNQIMGVPLSAATGAERIRINAGEINNQGVELFLKGVLIKTDPFQWELSATAARQWDQINKLYPGITQINENSGNLIRRKEEGKRMNLLYIQDYLKDEKGNRIVTDNGYYQLSDNPDDEICVGSTNTDLYGGLTSNFYLQGKWGMLNFMAGLDYKIGGKVLSYSNFYLVGNGLTNETLPYRDTAHGGLTWTETLSDGTTRERHDGVKLPGVKSDGSPNDIIISAYDYYSSYIHDMGTGWQPDLIKENSYVKFREMALSYTFPKQFSEKLKIQKLTMGLTARNLFYIYKTIPNIDAESMLGTGSDSWRENTNYPSTRNYGFQINISF
ncbi:MAG: SusC/RagA family TonB-linked outer membrane protein [Dysgonamonadaceae bacterium]|jgi:iron complex outermembrane receptor protein|nr:SusC/RagA family TonB-linked outer membrane protein [Dysgonamonadaceae bacterium]